jgi:hypothetical protein
MLTAAIAVGLVAALAGVAVLAWEVRRRRRAEEAVRKSEANYRNLFDNMTEEVHFWKLVRDEAGRIKTWTLVDANPPALKTWGRKTVEEIRGKTTDEIFGHGATDHYMPLVQKVMTQGVPHVFEDFFPNLDKCFRFTTVPLGDYFITTGTDITQLKKDQESLRQRMEELLELNAELTMFNDVAVGREMRMVELKKEINALCAAAGQPPRYVASEEEPA